MKTKGRRQSTNIEDRRRVAAGSVGRLVGRSIPLKQKPHTDPEKFKSIGTKRKKNNLRFETTRDGNVIISYQNGSRHKRGSKTRQRY